MAGDGEGVYDRRNVREKHTHTQRSACEKCLDPTAGAILAGRGEQEEEGKERTEKPERPRPVCLSRNRFRSSSFSLFAHYILRSYCCHSIVQSPNHTQRIKSPGNWQ